MSCNQSAGAVSFTHEWYRKFLTALTNEAGRFRFFTDSLEAGDILLRHDVDLSLTKALHMARLEADVGIHSTYCILLGSPLYNALERRDDVHEIASLGHDIALHFDPHAYWDGEPDPGALERRISEEEAILETITGSESSVVSFHRPPEWALDRSFDEFESTYAPAYFSEIQYVADSNQRWRENPPAFEPAAPTQLLVHPGLWGSTDEPFEACILRALSMGYSHMEARAADEFLDGAEPTLALLDGKNGGEADV